MKSCDKTSSSFTWKVTQVFSGVVTSKLKVCVITPKKVNSHTHTYTYKCQQKSPHRHHITPTRHPYLIPDGIEAIVVDSAGLYLKRVVGSVDIHHDIGVDDLPLLHAPWLGQLASADNVDGQEDGFEAIVCTGTCGKCRGKLTGNRKGEKNIQTIYKYYTRTEHTRTLPCTYIL